MADTETDYMAKAREAIALEDAAAAEKRVADRATQMRHADEDRQRHADLCAQHGLDPAKTSPRHLSDVMAGLPSSPKGGVTDGTRQLFGHNITHLAG